jgi:sigma-E factor negative regulatory protein RseB
MMRSAPRSSNLLASCALLCAGAAAAVATPPGVAEDARGWLARMNATLAQRNYDGTFLHMSDGRIETMRIVHRVHGARVTERLMSLDGSGREFVRNNDQLTCYLPDKNTILVEPRQAGGAFLGTLPQFGEGVDQHYRLEVLPGTRVLGHLAHGIAVTPKDQYRFGYRLWLDEETAMPLKTQLFDSAGHVIEQIQFAHLDMPDSIPDSALSPSIPVAGMRVIRHDAHEESPAKAAAFRTINLPPGFRLTMAGARVLGGNGEPVMHLVYSDGLATVSVFVEPGANDRPALPATLSGVGAPAADAAPQVQVTHESLSRVGSGFAFSTLVDGREVTAIGEVPAETVQFIANSVRLNATAASNAH